MRFTSARTSRFSLKLRIVIAFTIQTLLLAVVALSTINLYVDYIEESVLYEHLSKYLDAYVSRIDDDRKPVVPVDIKVYSANDGDLPEFVHGLAAGGHEVMPESGGAYHVLKKQYANGLFYLVKDQTVFEKQETEINVLALLVLLLFAVVSFVFSKSLADRIVQPVVTLSRKVSQLNVENMSDIRLDYPDDEIGGLVKMIYDQVNELGHYLQREKWFTGDISHELRTPMMVISSSIDLLRQGSPTPEQKEKIYENIENAIKGVNELIVTFLLLARGKDGDEDELVHTHVVDVANGIVDNMKLYAVDKSIRFKVNADEDYVVSLNPTLFSIVLSNLVKNAVFNTEKGEISVSISRQGFQVKDTGPGLPDVVRQFINGSGALPLKRSDSHVGLGLSIVKRVCEREHWQIITCDRDQGGTTFMVDFCIDSDRH
jgi:signal transduction histidine kinase